MPTYVYRCPEGHTFELFHAISDESVKRCPECGQEAKRVPAGGAGFLFKGSGFYITDYRSKGYKESAKKEGAAGSSPAEKPAAGSGGTSAAGSSSGAPSAPGSTTPSKPAKPEGGSSSSPPSSPGPRSGPGAS